MKKLCSVLICLLMLTCLLAGCSCDHDWESADCENPKTCEECGETKGDARGHDWEDSDCVNPKTCAECGETQGKATGHDWNDATCDTPKTCKVCGEFEGDPLSHSWTDATCQTPKTCALCGATEGSTLDHSWADATTEAPKTCTFCGQTTGDKIHTDSRFKTADCAPFFGTWTGSYRLDAEKYFGISVDSEELFVDYEYTYTYSNDGTMHIVTAMVGDDSILALSHVAAEVLYTQMAGQGLSRSEVNAMIMAETGKSVIQFYMDYYRDNAESLTTEVDGVYYVKDGMYYAGETWSSDFLSYECKFTVDGKLIIPVEGMDKDLELTKVK